MIIINTTRPGPTPQCVQNRAFVTFFYCMKKSVMKCKSSASTSSGQHHASSVCQKPSCTTGLTMAASAPSELLETKSSSISQASRASKSNKQSLYVREFCTPVFPHPSRETISSGRNNTCQTIYLTNIPDHELRSPMSDPVSTSNDQDFYAFWDSSKQDMYTMLSSLPEIDSPGLVSNSSNGSVHDTIQSSSFSTLRMEHQKKSSEKISCQSYKYTVVDGMVDDATAAGRVLPNLKTLKLHLRPNPLQKQKLEQWAGCSRFTYNKAVSISLTKGSTQTNAYKIRDRIITLKKRGSDTENSFFNNKPWLLECPKSIRFSAVSTAVSNIKSCFSNLKAGNIDRFDAPFKTKRNQILKGWTIGMEQKNVSRDNDKLYLFKDLLGEMRYSSTKQLHKLLPGINPTHDPKIQKSAFGEYFLVLSLDWSKRERQAVSLKIKVNEDGTVSCPIHVNHNTSVHKGFASVSLDPGIRKTLTSFSPENKESFIFGKGQAMQMTQLLLAYDKLLSETSDTNSTMNAKERKNAKKLILRIRKRIFYLKKEFRDQVSNFLARRYDILLVPKLKTAEMSLRTGRRLKTKVVRQMMTLGHSVLNKRIREKCLEYGSTFMEVKEHYTSQTCPVCGTLKKTSSETYCCDKCGFKCDRDVMGALNIYLKSLRKTKPCDRVCGPRQGS